MCVRVRPHRNILHPRHVCSASHSRLSLSLTHSHSLFPSCVCVAFPRHSSFLLLKEIVFRIYNRDCSKIPHVRLLILCIFQRARTVLILFGPLTPLLPSIDRLVCVCALCYAIATKHYHPGRRSTSPIYVSLNVFLFLHIVDFGFQAHQVQ